MTELLIPRINLFGSVVNINKEDEKLRCQKPEERVQVPHLGSCEIVETIPSSKISVSLS